jgi:hypothetical protein
LKGGNELTNNTNKTKLFENRNELKLYMENLISNMNKDYNKNIRTNIYNILRDTIQRNVLLLKLLKEFYNNMSKTGFRFNCNYNLDNRNYRVYHPLKVGSILKNSVNILNSSFSAYKTKNNPKMVGGIDLGITSSLRKGFLSSKGVASGLKNGFKRGVYRTVGSTFTPLIRSAPIISKQTKNYWIENNKKKKMNFKLPAMCDKILFALYIVVLFDSSPLDSG